MEKSHLTEADSALAHFAGTVAHELNNIFTAVVGNLSLIEMQGEHDENTVATVRDVMRIAQRGIDLSAKLQAFSGRQPLRRTLVDINEVLATTMRRLATTLPATIAIELRLTPDAGNALIDEDKLRGMLEELVRNACDAMPEGGALQLETRLRRIEPDQNTGRVRDFIDIRLRDNGVGMSDDVLARAFEPLFSTKGQGIHFGWGLANCRGFVRQSGGQMALTSRPGEGTQAQIVLPLAD